jgi:branched-chain amino acid transport system ATP-binding protein
MLLKVEDLVVRYGDVEAIKGISLELDEGGLVAVLGANGAGKSTLLRTISGLTKPTAGQILFQGNRIDGVLPHIIVARGVSHVAEGRRIFPDMLVRENLKMGGYNQRNRTQFEKDLNEVYELFPILQERRKQLAGTLSGGEQQMLAIGCSLMSNPKVILLDEPSLGLSPIMRSGLTEAIARLHQSGRSIILVEQNVKVAFELATYSYVLKLGEIVLSGRPKDIVDDQYIKEAYLGA